MGTRFQLTATSSKPLQGVRIVTEQFEVAGDREGWRTRPVNEHDLNALLTSDQPMMSSDGLQISATFWLTEETTSPPADADRNSTARAISESLALHTSANLRFFLHDVDDVMSVSPESLRVQGVPDASPTVLAQMSGIGNAITRLARIPVAGRIRDDYGIESAGFEFVVDDESNWRPRPFRNPPQRGLLDFEPQRNADEPYEVFEVQPLELSEGQTLTLSVVASDSRPHPAPAMTRGDPMVFLQRPISATMLALSTVLLIILALPAIRKKRDETFVED